MSIPGKNDDLIRRFKLYGLGFVFGIFIVSFVYKGKGCQLPGSMKMQELNAQKQEYTEHGECMLKCRKIAVTALRELMKTGKVNYDESNVHEKPYATYAVETTTTKGKKLRILLTDIDTVTRIRDILDLSLKKDTCKCN
jgi:hypothetical protein